MKRDFLSLEDLEGVEIEKLLDEADALKRKRGKWDEKLAGKQVALVFEKPSTRTRVSFEVAVAQLGGHPISLSASEMQIGRGESLEDSARALSRYVDAIVVRTLDHDRLALFAKAASVPVINALTERSHPCQGLADLMTIREHKKILAGTTLSYVGDGNNVAHSLLFGGSKCGMHVKMACPPTHQPAPDIVERSRIIAAESGGSITVSDVVAEAAVGTDVLYTDVWASMGHEEEAATRSDVFRPYQLNEEVLALADPDVIVMHCLPAHRGEEITASVLDGQRSVVWDQAENRLHTEKALLVSLLD